MGGMGFGLKLQPPTFCARSCLKPFEMLRNAPRSPSKTSMKLSGMPLGALKLPKGSGNVPKDLSEVLACLNLLVTLSITILHVHIMWQARKYCIPKEISITKKKNLVKQGNNPSPSAWSVMLNTHADITMGIGVLYIEALSEPPETALKRI